jgi:hypothetical protein
VAAVTAAVTVAVMAAVMVGGCSGDQESPGAPPATAATAYERALARIPLDGTPEQPLSWRVDDPSDPRADQPVRAVRHYLALGTIPAPVPPDYLELMASVAAAWRVERQRTHLEALASPDRDPVLGPRWVWVMDGWVDGDRAAVVACVDISFHGRVSEGGGREPPRDLRWTLERYELVQEPDREGVRRWKVDSLTFSGYLTPEDYPDLELRRGQCEEWADHPLEAAR